MLQLSAEANYGIEPGSVEDRAVGCLVGLAVGDALGAPVEFQKRGTFKPVTGYRDGGPFNLKAGEWTDDTSMALALADTMREDPHITNTKLLMTRWLAWYDQGVYSHNGKCLDIGGQTSSALNNWAVDQKSPRPTNSAGNGGIMRLAPVVVRHYRDIKEASYVARKQSDLTHNNPDCGYYADWLARLLVKGIEGGPVQAALRLTLNVCLLTENGVKATGYVKDTFEASCWAFLQSDTFAQAVLKAVNLGDDSDTVGAVTGQIAGAAYGLSAIPREWVAQLAWRDRIIGVGRKLYAAGS